jgi:hypothetical protein
MALKVYVSLFHLGAAVVRLLLDCAQDPMILSAALKTHAAPLLAVVHASRLVHAVVLLLPGTAVAHLTFSAVFPESPPASLAAKAAATKRALHVACRVKLLRS